MYEAPSTVLTASPSPHTHTQRMRKVPILFLFLVCLNFPFWKIHRSKKSVKNPFPTCDPQHFANLAGETDEPTVERRKLGLPEV